MLSSHFVTAIFAALPLTQAIPFYFPPSSLLQPRATSQNLTCNAAILAGQIPTSAVTTQQTGSDCTQYGDPPAQVLSDASSADGLQSALTLCHGEIVNVTDILGEARQACLYKNPASTTAKPLPLVVWLHPSEFSATFTWPLTGWDAVRNTQSLNNEDPSALGFSYVLPFGRNIAHHYPASDATGLGWDNWYRNVDRTSSSLNADVDFLDKVIALAKSSVAVDNRRVFMSGWSNGAAMSMFYSLNTDGIAASSVYSAPDPYRDTQDPCTQVPYPSFATPTQDVHNYCDLWGICTTGLYFYTDLKKRYPNLIQSFVVIDEVTTAVMSQDAGSQCSIKCQSVCQLEVASTAHDRFPTARNTDTFFTFFKNNPLPASLTWGKP